MKSIISLVFVFLTSLANGQTDTSIVGIWKIISIESDGIYYNSKKDSISLSAENKIKYPDSAAVKQLNERMKSIYSTIRFHFDKDNIFKQLMMGNVIYEGSYRTIASKNVVEIITKNSLNQDVVDKAKYNIEKGLLLLTLKWDEAEVDFVLEKIN